MVTRGFYVYYENMIKKVSQKDNLFFVAELISNSADASDFMAQDVPMTTESLTTLLLDKKYTLYVHQKSDTHKPDGFVLIYIKQTPEFRHMAHIQAIRVLPEMRGQGIGSMLLEHCIHDMHQRKISLIKLDVLAINKDATKIYKKYGFIRYARLEKGFKYKNSFETVDSYVLNINQ